jgi:hypothetical protein
VFGTEPQAIDEDRALREFFKALAEPIRIRMAARLIEGPSDVATLARDLDLPLRVCSKHVLRLVELGLASEDQTRRPPLYRFAEMRLRELSEQILESPRMRALGSATDERSRVLAAFYEGGRLRSIPTGDARKLIVLEAIAERFSSDRTYSEREVNELLKQVYEYDYVTLRRLLVDFHFLNREAGVYWVGEGRRDPHAAPVGGQP